MDELVAESGGYIRTRTVGGVHYIDYLAEYEQAGCIECRGSFDKSEDKKLILDILDLYCDVQEALAEIGE